MLQIRDDRLSLYCNMLFFCNHKNTCLKKAEKDKNIGK